MNDLLFERWLYESESDSLDFKRDQYKFHGASAEEKSELLKDILAMANSWSVVDGFHLHISVYDWPTRIKIQESDKGLKVDFVYHDETKFKGLNDQILIGQDENMWVCTVDESVHNIVSMWLPARKLGDMLRISDISLGWRLTKQLIAAINAMNRFKNGII